MESNTIAAEIAESGDNSPGCSLKSEVRIETDGASYRVWLGGKVIAGGSPSVDVSNVRPEADNIGQYMKRENPCEKGVNNSEPFPSLLESAEQDRRLARNRGIEFVRKSWNTAADLRKQRAQHREERRNRPAPEALAAFADEGYTGPDRRSTWQQCPAAPQPTKAEAKPAESK